MQLKNLFKIPSVALGILLLFLLAGCQQNTAFELGELEQVPWASGDDEVYFAASSGIVYHPGRDTLFVVGDKGHVGEISLGGEIINRVDFGGLDFEGVTYNPVSGLLYAVLEKQGQIYEIDPESLKRLRVFDYASAFLDTDVYPLDGFEIEGITFVPREGSPLGGVFLLANKNRGDDVSGLSSGFVTISLPAASTDGVLEVIAFTKVNIVSITGIQYLAESDALLMISDRLSFIYLVSLTGEMIDTASITGDDQEGVARDASGVIYISQDFGSIFKMDTVR